MVDLGVFTFRPIWLHLLHLRLQIPGWYNNATNSHGPWVWYIWFPLVSSKTGYLPDDKQLIWNRLEIHPGFAGNEIQTIRWASVTPVRWGVTVGTVGCQSSQSPCITSICDALLMQNWTLLAWDDPWHSMKASRDFRRTFWTSIIGLCDCEFPSTFCHIAQAWEEKSMQQLSQPFGTTRVQRHIHPAGSQVSAGRGCLLVEVLEDNTWADQARIYIYVCICMYLIYSSLVYSVLFYSILFCSILFCSILSYPIDLSIDPSIYLSIGLSIYWSIDLSTYILYIVSVLSCLIVYHLIWLCLNLLESNLNLI